MEAEGVPAGQRAEYLKWLRYYLDFCSKHAHPPRDRDSLEPFLQNLAEKRQSAEQHRQAASSVGLYYELMKRWAGLSAANARIRDVDVARETANLTRAQILVQAGVSVLAQANQAPQIALSLLQ